VAGRVLRLYCRRIEKRGRADGVAREAEDVQKWEIGRQALGGSPLVVEKRLWVEGEAPGEEVEPAAGAVGVWSAIALLGGRFGSHTVIWLWRANRCSDRSTCWLHALHYQSAVWAVNHHQHDTVLFPGKKGEDRDGEKSEMRVQRNETFHSFPTGHVHVLAEWPWACRVPVACSPTQHPRRCVISTTGP